MSRYGWPFLALLFTGLALAPTAAHVMELLNKIDLPAAEYRTVQQIYRGWALLGIVVLGALVATFALALALRGEGRAFVAAVVACASIVVTQVIFWVFTFPVNQATVNWTRLPDNWQHLRRVWEYSHASSAVFNLAAFVATILAVLWRTTPDSLAASRRR